MEYSFCYRAAKTAKECQAFIDAGPVDVYCRSFFQDDRPISTDELKAMGKKSILIRFFGDRKVCKVTL